MKAIVIAIVITLGFGTPALAQHNRPARSKVLKVGFVSAYDACTAPSLEHRPPFVGASACVPVLSTDFDATHQITFGPDGRLAATAKITKGDVRVIFKGRDIFNHGAPFSGALNAAVNLRATDAGCVAPDFSTSCTLVDLPFQFAFGCTAGVCKGKVTANLVIPGAIQDGDQGNIELGQISVFDADGDDCFRAGLFIP